MSIVILTAVMLLAFSNGANDNFKGVATLFGSGTADYRRALIWATVTTLAGSLLALLLAQGLVQTFTGKGFVADSVTTQATFLTAVSLGAALTVLLATRLGLPVSTTHALTGALVGAGVLATEGDVRLATLGSSFLLPLGFGPVIAILITLAVYPLFKLARRWSGVTARTCLCVENRFEDVIVQGAGTLALRRTGVALRVDEASACVERYDGQLFAVEGRTGDRCASLLERRGGRLCPRPERHTEDRGAADRRADRCADRGLGAGGGGHGGRRSTERAPGRRDDESQDHAHEPRTGLHRQPGHRAARHRRQPLRPAGLDHSRLGGVALRHWRRQSNGKPGHNRRHSSRMGDNAPEKMAPLCAEFGISRKTGYKIYDRYKDGGVQAFSDRSRRPYRQANRLAPAIEATIIRLKREYPGWGAPKIREKLRTQAPGPQLPAISTVHAVLDRHGLVQRRRRRRHTSGGTALSRPTEPNALWCADYKGEFMLGNRRYCYPLTITDFASRYLLTCEALLTTQETFAFTVFEQTFKELDGVLSITVYRWNTRSRTSSGRARPVSVSGRSDKKNSQLSVTDDPSDCCR